MYLLQQNFMNMDCQTSSKPILIYFKARGNAQVIRCVLLEIGVDFEQIFVQHNGNLDPNITKKYHINLKQLPYLLHNGFVINGIFPIIKYCCTYFDRLDLLGKNFYDTVQIAQFMVKQIHQKGIILRTLFTGLREVKQKNKGEEGLLQLTCKIHEVVKNTKLLNAIREMFGKSNGYLRGYLTVLDFTVYERIFYATNLASKFKPPELELGLKYREFFESTDFYKKHENRLSQYKIFFPEFDCDLNQMIKKMWIGDTKFIQCE